jgi:hypothetical protein
MTSLPRQQQGVVLLVSLMLLLILSLLALTAANRSTLQERMAANSQDNNRSFQAAEAGRTASLATIDSVRTAGVGAVITLPNTSIGTNAVYCAQFSLGKLILMTRNGRVLSNSLDVRKNTLETRQVDVLSKGSLTGDTTCATPLAWHESGFVIPLFK